MCPGERFSENDLLNHVCKHNLVLDSGYIEKRSGKHNLVLDSGYIEKRSGKHNLVLNPGI